MKIAPGIRQTAFGFEAYVRIKGKLRTKRFPPDIKPVEMHRWLDLQRGAAHFKVALPPTDTPLFADDVAAYLRLVAAMPTLKDRTYRMDQWTAAFGHVPRSSITSQDIRAQLERWRFSGHADKKKQLAPASLNQRRTALLHFYTVMNGKGGYNPVRDVAPYREEELPLALPSYADCERAILAADGQGGQSKRSQKTRARLLVMLYTGWPNALLKRLKPEHVHWKTRTVTLHGRRKGKGTKPVTLPISPQALKALKLFKKAKAWGDFSNSSVHSALHRGCVAAGVTPFRVYDLRHRFGTTLVAASNDERGAAELLMSAQVRRYSRQAASERAKATLDAAFS